MRITAIAVFVVLALAPATVRADPVMLKDPDKWIAATLKEVAAGKIDDAFVRNFLKVLDKPDIEEKFSESLKPLKDIGSAVFMEKVNDVKYGNALRQVVYLALYRQSDYVYFKFTMKKNRGGWLISNFAFSTEQANLFPKGFIVPE